MKTICLGKYFLQTSVMALLLFFTGAVSWAVENNPKRDCNYAGSRVDNCKFANNYTVISPYWQVDSGSYTFIAVSHSSLSGMASQIGLHVNALTSTGSTYGTVASFTVQSGTTERLFIVPSVHKTINATAVPTAKFMTGTSDFTHGAIRVSPVMTHPFLKYGNGNWRQGGATAASRSGVHTNGDGFRDITMLSYWGSIIIEANTTGFAMEFLGDMNDSIALPQSNHKWATATGTAGDHVGIGSKAMGARTLADGEAGDDTKHLYEVMHTGPNLQ